MMTSEPYIVETAVLLLLAFVLGGLAGFWARRWFSPRGVAGASDAPAAVAEAAPPPSAPTPEKKPAEAAPVAKEKEPAKSTPKAKRSGASKSTKVATPKTKPAKAAKPAETSSPAKGDEAGKPPLLSSAREGGADDLKKIKGIGPKLEKLLNELGVYHYDQIAAWDAEAVAWVDDKLSFRGRIDRENWIAQAKTLAGTE
jgi:NADH-quinone oxidoreductase subunit E